MHFNDLTFIVGWIVDVLSRSVDEKLLYDRTLLRPFASTFAIDASELRILFCRMIDYKLYVPLSWCAPDSWGTLETDSNTIIKLLEDEKRLRWKFNGPGLCCWARPSPSLPTLISSRSPRSNQSQTSRTTSRVTQKWDSSHPSWDHQARHGVLPVAGYGGEREK